MMEKFNEKIADKYNLNPEMTEEFLEKMSPIGVNKNTRIVERGGFNENFYFVKTGILRAYIPTEDYEQTLWFGYPGQAIIDVWCYNYGLPSPISIEAVVGCELLSIHKQEIEKLCSESLPLCNLVRKIFMGYATEAEESFTSLLECDNGMSRYLSLLTRHPELLQHVPLKKLASYIQLAPQSLSRIRAQIK